MRWYHAPRATSLLRALRRACAVCVRWVRGAVLRVSTKRLGLSCLLPPPLCSALCRRARDAKAPAVVTVPRCPGGQAARTAEAPATTGESMSESEVIRSLREDLESSQQHLEQKKALLSEALAQLKVFLKDEEMLESEIGENERLAEEIEDLKYDLTQSERARKWLAQRLSATVESFQRLSARYLSQKVFGYLLVNALHERTSRESLKKCIQRWQSGKMAAAFDKWQAACVRKQQLKMTCSKIITRWKNMGVSVSFSKWASDTERKKQVQQRMRNIALLWRNRSTGAAFLRWIEHTDERKRMQNITFRILARWKNKTISTVFWSWTGIVLTTCPPIFLARSEDCPLRHLLSLCAYACRTKCSLQFPCAA